jgi:hypothetical protein
VYELPFGTGRRYLSSLGRAAGLLVGGWQLNAIASWQTGVHRSVSSTNLTGLSYITQRANATGISPYSSFNNITPGSDFEEANAAR